MRGQNLPSEGFTPARICLDLLNKRKFPATKKAPLIIKKVNSGVLLGTVNAATRIPSNIPISTKTIVSFFNTILRALYSRHNAHCCNARHLLSERRFRVAKSPLPRLATLASQPPAVAQKILVILSEAKNPVFRSCLCSCYLFPLHQLQSAPNPPQYPHSKSQASPQ
jgi:hypothetical protein